VELLRGALGEIEIPVLLVWGTADRAVDPQSCAALRERLVNSESVCWEGVGHLPFEEVPGEFNRVAMEFLGRRS
jgi:pimeloyl-ACP methyl ester carboxylesterase